jgi:hypothetical protein
MPNWVYNGLTVEGNPESVKKMMDQLNQPFTVVHDSWDVSTNTFMKKNTLYPNPVFAFWNIVKPTDLDAYHNQPKHGQPFDTSGDDWYNWNLRNWGTKWDVAVSSTDNMPNTYMEETANGDNYVVYYNFETAWGVPDKALVNLSSQYPDLLFTLSYEEETGWGGEFEILRGVVLEGSSYNWKCQACDYMEVGDPEDNWSDEHEDIICPKCQYPLVDLETKGKVEA